jgi:hypothetical protein
MSKSYLAHQFSLESVDYSIAIPTRLNIKKRREHFVYRSLSNEDNINVAYAIAHDVVPASNLAISDRSTSLVQNRIPKTNLPQVVTAGSIVLNVDQFLVTDEFTTDTPTQPSVPLFYEHKLINYNEDLVDFDNKTLLSIEFMDQDYQPVRITEYELDDYGYIFNNIENLYNEVTGELEAYFVKYTVRTISGPSQTVTIHHELINNKPVFVPATFSDIDDDGLILAGYVYLIEQIPGLGFSITLPEVARYGYIETPESRIRVLPPPAVDVSIPWNVRVSNGKFVSTQRLSESSSRQYTYRVAEFDSQGFSPYPPFKQIIEQEATWLTPHLIHVPKNIAYDPDAAFFVDILIRDANDDVIAVYTNDTDKVGLTWSDTLIEYEDKILSIDGMGGIIELQDELLDTNSAFVSYISEEHEYEFIDIDFNPIDNTEILQQRIVLYIQPESALTGTLEKSLYYLVVNALGEIEYSSQVAENVATGLPLDGATQMMYNQDFNSDGTTRHLFYYDRTSTASGLQVRASGLQDNVSEFSFIDKYTVDSILVRSRAIPTGYAENLNFLDNPRFLVLGDLYVGERESPELVTTLDIREFGGGIKPEHMQDALLEQPEVRWYMDSSARLPYPGAGSFMVDIPMELLDAYGGDFTEEQVRSIVERHTQYGNYAAIRYYGIDPILMDLVVGSGEYTVSWPSYGDEITYNVYQSRHIDTGFVLINEVDLFDNPGGNSFAASGLTPSTKYYVKVGATDENVIESFSQTISVTTTSI